MFNLLKNKHIYKNFFYDSGIIMFSDKKQTLIIND